MTFGERVEAARQMRGLTQGQLEAKSGLDQGHISQIIKGKRLPRIDKVMALAQALDVSIDWLCEMPKRDKEVLEPIEDEALQRFHDLSVSQQRTILDTMESMRKNPEPPLARK